MGILDGKVGMIFGIANNRSIAWGIAQALHDAGCTLGFSYAGEALEKRVRPLAESIGVDFVEQCDVSRDADITAVFAKAAQRFGRLDILVHSIGYAPREALDGLFVSTTREQWHTALDVSAYSFVALAREAAKFMDAGGAMLTLTHLAAEKVFPHYNVMGIAKAALEASVRYLAHDLGPRGIRVNAVSAGPVKTLAAAGVTGLRDMLHYSAQRAPLRRNISQDEVGQAALFLLSDMASATTGEVLFVDSGYNILGVFEPIETIEALRQARRENLNT